MVQPRALIVDDDEPIRAMLAAIVRQEGFAVDTARDGEEAVAKLQSGDYSVVILDLMMPRMNGYDVLRHMNDTKPDLLKRTIITTAVPEREIERNLHYTVFNVHTKPFDLQMLISDLRACAGR